jgi:hypothetical protein
MRASSKQTAPTVPGRDEWKMAPDSADLPLAWRRLFWPGLALLVGCAMTPYYLGLLRPPDDRIVDLFQEWASARNYWEGLPIYTDHSVAIPRYLGLDVSQQKNGPIEVNAHPPTAVLLALPLAFLRYPDAVLVWNLISLGLLALSLAVVWRGFRIPFSSRSFFALIAGLMVCGPLMRQVYFAQLNLLILAFLTGVWAADRSRNSLRAGLLLGLATAIKLFPGFLFLHFLIRRQWRSLIAGLLTLAGITMITSAVLGLETYREYIWGALPRVAKFRGNWENASLVGFWIKLFDPPSSNVHVLPLWRSPAMARLGIMVSCLLVMTTLAWTVRRARTRSEQDLAFGLSLTAMLLISPITWDHYLLLLPIAIVAAGVYLPRSLGPRALFATIMIAFWLFLPIPQVVFLVDGGGMKVANPLHTLTVLSYQCYALVALFVLITVESGQVRDRSCA